MKLLILGIALFCANSFAARIAPGNLLISGNGILMAVPKDTAPKMIYFHVGNDTSLVSSKCFREPIAGSDPDDFYRVAALSLAKSLRSNYPKLKPFYVTCLPTEGDTFPVEGKSAEIHAYENPDMYSKSKFAAHLTNAAGAVTDTCVYYSLYTFQKFLVYLLGDTFHCTSPGL